MISCANTLLVLFCFREIEGIATHPGPSIGRYSFLLPTGTSITPLRTVFGSGNGFPQCLVRIFQSLLGVLHLRVILKRFCVLSCIDVAAGPNELEVFLDALGDIKLKGPL